MLFEGAVETGFVKVLGAHLVVEFGIGFRSDPVFGKKEILESESWDFYELSAINIQWMNLLIRAAIVKPNQDVSTVDGFTLAEFWFYYA